MEKEIGFYMVYLDGGSTPTFKHDTYDSAVIEARRLSSMHERKTYVLKTKTSISVRKEYDELKMGKPNENALPF